MLYLVFSNAIDNLVIPLFSIQTHSSKKVTCLICAPVVLPVVGRDEKLDNNFELFYG